MLRASTFIRLAALSFLLVPILSFAEGSKNLTPSATGTATTANNFVGYLMHDQEFGTSGNFLNAAATADERLYIHIKAGETVYMGFRRILPLTNFRLGGNTFGNATLTLRENDGTLVNTFGFTADAGTTQSSGFASGTGVIESYAEALAGPAAVVGVSGYNAISYTNTTGSDQDFYIELVEAGGEESWYDLWDVSVYDGTTEKPGRMFCKRWAFNGGAFGQQFSDDFQLFIRIPSTVAGASAGNYIKEIDLAGIEPFATSVFANSTGASIAGTSDLNGDGVTDFRDARRSQDNDVGGLEYDIFINNPDVEIYATTILPTVRITQAVFGCNGDGTGGEASITIESNQSGVIAVFLDLDGTPGYNDGTEDVILEQLIDASSGTGSATISWDGLNGFNATVPSGTSINISGRFSAGPLHIPLFDPEVNDVGINMIDVRPQTSFDLIYWDDRSTGLNSSPNVELTGTNTGQHTWNGNTGDGITVNTWSYGFLQSNTENVTFSFDCDPDGDGVNGSNDLDADNDGILNSVEGDPYSDADGDGVFDYLDADFAGYVDSNNDGVNDNFDQDLDGVIDALDLDSDNDGVPDLQENDQPDTNGDGELDTFVDATADGVNDSFQGASVTNNLTAPDDCQEADAPTHTFTFTGISTLDATADVDLIFDIQGDYGPQANENFTVSVDGTGLGTTFDPGGADCALTTDFTVTIPQATWNANNDDGAITIVVQAGTGVNDNVGGCNDADGDGIEDGSCLFNIRASYTVTNPTPGTAYTLIDTDSDGVNDFLDIDSDNDGIVDVIEFGGSADASNGQIAGFTDTNSNGWNDTQETVALAQPDTDADGTLFDARDIDSDNDGIPDNEEAQTSASFIASVAGDTNGNGLLDIYDPTNGGTFLPTVDTDTDGTADYLSSDADGDGVADIIEGHDANFNGFADWDTNSNNLLETADFSGFDSDGDNDGLWNVFDTDNGGTAAPTQNTDGADNDDWQDTDDDNDGILTSGEDTNTNNDFTDDKTQGQGGSSATPNYLFRGDYDGDAIVDALDADSDNDGILDEDEDNGETVNPSEDTDGDGIPNYRDASDAAVTGALTSTADSNGDGIYDVFDSDLDGVPDFLDLDSDNDGVWDAVEANEGAVPFGLSTTTGQFTLQDPDNDGIMNFVDTDDVSAGGSSDLANPDTDGDGLSDYRDIDSDGDGIPDIIETQTTAAFFGLANADADGDGIDNNFDPDAGGTLITPVNTEGQDVQDYLDTDSDNDGVLDVIEGDDVNQDGFGDWDANQNNLLDDGSFNVDTDGDGLSDLFDTVTKGTAGNETGSNADLQNTDGIDFRNWRDSNDDNDAVATADEDANSNGNFADDLNADPTANIPDFLFFNDFDNDGITDANDGDSDNDGILDINEAGGESVDPSGDADADGIPNFRDADIVGLTSTADTNGDGVFDVFDQDLDGIPDFRDRDSDNDGVPDLIESGGADTDGNGIADGIEDADNDGIPDDVDVDSTGGVDSDGDSIDDAFDFSIVGGTDTDGDDIIDGSDPDSDGDGIADTYDADNGGATITPADYDGDGLVDYLDRDSDNDGIPDLIEYGGTDTNGDGVLDDLTDTNTDGMADLVDVDNGGTALTRPDSDNDGIRDYQDLDSDNDGLTDTVESGGSDTNNDGAVDDFSSDTDGDGLANSVDPDNGGTPIGNSDLDGDGVLDFRDLDVDNDGYPDILEAGGTDSDNDGIVNNQLDTDNDGVPDNVDVSQFATNGGSGTDTDGDQIDDTFDVDQTGGSDSDGDSIDNTFDTDANGDGYDDAVEASPYGQDDKEGDGNKDFRDMDSDGDGIPDVTEFGQTINTANAQISGFTDSNSNGWNDTQESTPINPVNSDSDGLEDYRDIDSDDDGIVDNLEAQTNGTFIAISDTDSDDDGLDDAYDPDNGGTILVPVNTDGTGSADYLDSDSDDDNVPDAVEGANDDRSQFADWDSNSNNDATDEASFAIDNDNDGLRDLFDTDFSATSANVIGSSSNAQDSDADGTWDHQDTDDDGDGALTSAEDTDTADGDPTNEFGAGGSPIPDYLYGVQDNDGDGQDDVADLDSDNDGILDTDEAGGIAINPSADTDSDGIPNYQDSDIDGDGTVNTADTDTGGVNTTTFTDSNSDGVIDQFDRDLDGRPDFLDLDSDNDGITDILEVGLTDGNADGTLDEGSGITDTDNNGLDDAFGTATVVNSADETLTATGPLHTINFTVSTTDVLVDATFSFDISGDYGPQANEDYTVTLEGGIDLGTFDNAAGADCDVLNNNITINAADWNAANDDGTVTITIQGGTGVNQITCTGATSSTLANVSATFAVLTPVSASDTDADGISDYLDLDSDNDGIVDNVEAQTTAGYIAPVAGDTDADGILDVYDGNNGGTAITPENTDGTDNADYLDTDSDNDTVLDNIEAFDADSDGFASWDTDGDNDITDEGGSGYNVDTDNDGLWLIFDNSNGLGTIANLTGSNNNRQDTDGDGAEDWRDNNDDNDLLLTSAEDNNTNSNFADDFTQGGGTTPDYLFNPDVDGDNISDSADADSDNDGILNTDEYAGTTYAVGSDVSGNAGTPFGDSDGDGIFNYLDDNDVNFTITDVNSDGVDDRVDQDRDGIPNFFDLDSDNDGILDAIEANSGVTPAIGSFSTSTGRFSGTDGDSDGIVDAVESAPLAKPNFDSDGLDDYLDLDTDNDGITDNVEAQTTVGRVNPSDTDTDGDGWDDSYDPDNGGTAIVPINTDGSFTISDTEPDYRDIDSDNDNDGIGFVGDQIEGFDANRNGFSELDSDLDLDLTDETGYNVDTDNDGLWDLYDNFSGRGVNNINGTSANLQDTDGDGTLDFRDQDDDEDNISTAVEDVDSDGNWTNDKFQGGGATPDYLFFNDSDRDRVADGQDADGDNDGISDTNEYDNTILRNPFGDQDGDGVFNYNDPDNPNRLDGTTPLTDANSDGIWDEYDTDLDGVPNFFDLDSDNDGIPDIVEAGGTDSNNDGILDGIEDSDDDGIPDNVDVDNFASNGGSGVDTDGDDIDDTFDSDQTAGTDADGDSILDTFDFDDDGDGIINIIDTDEGGAALADGDFDGDGLVNRIDLDSDSDGITDLIEGRGSDTDGNGVLDTTGDTDGDGWGNLHDPTNGGTPLALPDTDGDGSEDYLDIDADADGVFDYNEGFDDDEDDTFTDDYTARATAFGNASFYDPLNLFWYNDDDDMDNVPNFLDPNSGRFVDTDSDGIIDLFDTDNGGNFYGNLGGKPDNDNDGTENYIDLDGGFILNTTTITTGEDLTADNFTVVLTQQPTSNVVINVSTTSDEATLSTSTLTFTNGDWNMAQTVTVTGANDFDNDGDIAYTVLVSVSDALSDDNFDDAPNQTVNGTNLDNEGSIRVSTNTLNTSEDLTTADFTVELTVAPTTNVVIDLTVADLTEGGISGATLVSDQLTFTNANWNIAQTVTVTGVDDNLLDGDIAYNITASVNDPASDDGFDAAADEIIAVTNADNDQGYILSKTTATTNEDGTTDQFTVVLDVQPATGQVVVIDLTESSDEGSVGPTQLTFDEFNWNVAQTVTITPADDADLDGNQVYNLTLSINTGSTTDNSFDGLADQTVSVTNQDDDTLPLPLDLLSFEGEYEDGSVWLDWVTANEKNVDFMAIERSLDGTEYEELGRISAGNIETSINEYAFEDERPVVGFNYYRLRTVDFDGSYEYSNVIIVMATAQEFEIKAYPNPVVERLNISSTLSLGSMSYSVYDIRGKLVRYGRFRENEFDAEIDLSQLPTGIYQLMITSPTMTEHIRIKKLSDSP
ncbi:MAG: T9SS type A sorting domain-containing protein [Cytophagales bacterium]|nr:T9SS type A sorting domain-containing protein [Cytophagales bacterium]